MADARVDGEMDRFAEPAELIGLLGDWQAGPGVLYRRLARAVERAVADGELVPGSRLPPERALAAALAVSRTTVVAAYDELRSRDVVVSRQGSGTRVSPGRRSSRTARDSRVHRGAAQPIMRRFATRTPDLISMAQAVEGGTHELTEAVLDAVEADLPTLLTDVGYHPRGLAELRAAVAEHYGEAGLPTDPDQVLVTAGAHQAVALAAQLYVSQGATVVVESPSWPGCLDLFGAAGGRLTGVPLDDEGVRADLLATALADGPALAFLMPTFHNPTGRLMSTRRRRQVAELTARWGVPVVEDNAYATAATSGSALDPPPLAAFAPRHAEVLTIGSVSKAVWGGLRIGWVRAPAPVIDRLARHKALADLGSPALDQAVATRLLPRLGELTANRATAAQSQLSHVTALLDTHLPDWTWTEPDGGSVLWIELPDTDAAIYTQVALRHGVEVIPGRATDPTGAHDTYLRLPYTFPTDVMSEAVARLASAWHDLVRHGPP